jgi:amidohydrolase
MRFLHVLTLFGVLSINAFASASSLDKPASIIPLRVFEEFLPEFCEVRKQFHQIPELKYEETETASRVISFLRSYGYEDIITGIGGTGVSVVIDSGIPGKTVALRADMDALPLQEETGLEYVSMSPGKMHACGHDGHMTTLLMVAKVVMENRSVFKGKIKFIFQPAEEGGRGAEAMIKGGVLESPKVDAIFGYHNWPLEKGMIATKVGSIMAGDDRISIKIRGKGGHAALPHNTVNPLIVGSNLLQAYQQLVAQKNPTDLVVLNFCAFNAGTAYNVVPDTAELKGTLRTVSVETREFILRQMQVIAEGYSRASGAEIEVESVSNCIPTINSAREVETVLNAAASIVPMGKVKVLEHPVMPGEDFSFYLNVIPGCFFFVGYGEDRASLHSPHFDFEDAIMPVAACTLANSAINFLNKED